MSDLLTKPEPESDEIVIDLRQFLQVIMKWKALIAGGTIVCILTAAILSYFVLPPVYEAQVLLLVTQASDKVQVLQQNQSADGLEGVVNTVSRMPVLTMNTYLGQVKSEAVLKRVITALKLDKNLYTVPGLAGMIDATVVKDSNLIDIKVHNSDPVLAERIGNTLAREFLNVLSEKNQEQMSRSVDFLTKQREQANKDLQKAVKALQDFNTQPGGVAVLEQQFAKKSDDLASYQSQLTLANVEVQQLEAAVSSLERELAATPRTVEVQRQDPATGQVATYQGVNPVYQAVAEQLSGKKTSLAEKRAQIAGLERVVSTLTADLDSLQSSLTAKKVVQDQLQAEVDRLKKTTQTLAEKETETQVAKSIDLGDTSVIVASQADVPTTPIKPRKALNMAIAMVLGLMAFTILAFVMEYMDNTLKNEDDISRELGLPVLGLIPHTDNPEKGSYYYRRAEAGGEQNA